MLRTIRRGLAPVGSGWGVREREEDWMDVVIGLRCCSPNQPLRGKACSGGWMVLLSLRQESAPFALWE